MIWRQVVEPLNGVYSHEIRHLLQLQAGIQLIFLMLAIVTAAFVQVINPSLALWTGPLRLLTILNITSLCLAYVFTRHGHQHLGSLLTIVPLTINLYLTAIPYPDALYFLVIMVCLSTIMLKPR
jgi:hypothetical protein